MPIKKMTKVKSLSDLYQRAEVDERYQRLCIVALENLGCEHLADGAGRFKRDKQPKWKAYYNGLVQYVTSLVSEYGESEGVAFRSVCDEVNGVLDCIDQAELEWEQPA